MNDDQHVLMMTFSVTQVAMLRCTVARIVRVLSSGSIIRLVKQTLWFGQVRCVPQRTHKSRMYENLSDEKMSSNFWQILVQIHY